jgi:hypothetical protein
VQSIGIIGLDQIAKTHVTAIGKLDGLVLGGGYDPQGAPGYWPADVPCLPSLEALVGAGLDAYVVATPSAEHASTAREVWRIDPRARVLVEKPLATEAVDARELQADGQVVGLYHAAYAPEVDWAVGRMGAWAQRHGAVVDYLSFFSDPVPEAAVERFGNSWLDSGTNALSVLRRLGVIDVVDSLDRVGGGMVSTVVARGRGANGERGTIVTQWDVCAPSKSTTLRFADGALAVVDHQAVAARVVGADGDLEEVVGWGPGGVARLTRHYVRMYRRELVDGESDLTDGDKAAIVEMLFAGR